MKKYTSLIGFGRFCRLYAVIGSIFIFFGVFFSPSLFIDSPSYGVAEMAILLTLAVVLTSIHFLLFSAIPDLINLLIRLEKNTRGISDLNDILRQQATQRSIQTEPNPQVSNKPTLNVPKQ